MFISTTLVKILEVKQLVALIFQLDAIKLLQKKRLQQEVIENALVKPQTVLIMWKMGWKTVICVCFMY